MTSAMLLDGFSAVPSPVLLPDPAIVLGGTELLTEFLRISAASRTGGQLSIVVPFVGKGIATAVLPWRLMQHAAVDFLVVTASTQSASIVLSEFGGLPWRSLVVRIRSRIHSKVYCFLAPSGPSACLVGSGNLTKAGLTTNREANVMFSATRDPEIGTVIKSCSDYIGVLSKDAKPFPSEWTSRVG
jgi:hypothetical protein